MRMVDADALKEMKFSGGMHDDNWIIYVPFREVIKNINKAPTVGGWISVKDRLPEVGQKVLTYSKYGHVSDRTLERHGGQNGYDVLLFSPDGMKPGTDITHWMPLPEPPKDNEP